MSAQEQPPVRAPRPASPYEVVGIGIAFSAAGLYFILGAVDVLPLPSDAARSPAAIVFCAGLAFLFVGLTCMVRARAGVADTQDEIPETAPRWTQVSYRMLGIGAAGALATIGTWIAIGSGPRTFSLSAPFVQMQTTGELIGRSVFGLGAVIVWIYVIALTMNTARKFFAPSPSIVPEAPSGPDSPAPAAQRQRVTTPE